MQLNVFKQTIWNYYKKNRRDFPWRNTHDPYRILVSEIMLQQTQAPRVVKKYEVFLKKFPTIKKLAHASLVDVLFIWNGLGYNRRALALKETAKIIVEKYSGNVPTDFEVLISLPGIGPATAGDILAFAWNIPSVIIETNIRTVFIHFFFKDNRRKDDKHNTSKKIHDRDILPLIGKTLDTKNPKEWYYALMDYGALLKKTHGNASRKSVHYIKQSPFKGSNRQLRSHILKLIMQKGLTAQEILHLIQKNMDKKILKKGINQNLIALQKEGLIVPHNKDRKAQMVYRIA